jgi:hypothetical protein
MSLRNVQEFIEDLGNVAAQNGLNLQKVTVDLSQANLRFTAAWRP